MMVPTSQMVAYGALKISTIPWKAADTNSLIPRYLPNAPPPTPLALGPERFLNTALLTQAARPVVRDSAPEQPWGRCKPKPNSMLDARAPIVVAAERGSRCKP